MLSRKYYKLIAKAIKENTESNNSIKKDDLITDLAISFKSDNPCFNWLRFEDACE